MRKILIRNCMRIHTMDGLERILDGYDIEIDGKEISKVEKEINPDGHEVIDASNMLALPGFVNTHHHFYQVLTRNLKPAQNAKLFDWLVYHYGIWGNLTPNAIYQSALAATAELLLTGCTTTADHLYLVPKRFQSNSTDFFEREISAAKETGIRFHMSRGSMSRGKSKGGLPPDDVVQDEDSILKDCEVAIDKFHDDSRFAMTRVFLAPCSPFSITLELMRDSAILARERSVLLHTHLCETKDEETYSLEKYGKRPLELMEETGWIGNDVWYAHGIYFNDDEIRRLGETRTGITHCPTSNLRLGSGIAKVPSLLEADVRVGLGVDGSASADSSNMLRELKNTLLIHRIGTGVDSMTAEAVLMMATKGGASLLGRDDIGSIEAGKAADIVLWDMKSLAYAGALHDPLAALLFCGIDDHAHTVIVNGKIVVKEKHLLSMDENKIAANTNEESKKLIEK